MPVVPDSFAFLTDIVWDGSGPVVGQLRGTTINVDGYSTGGDFIAESTTLTADDANSDGLLADLNGPGGAESVTIADSATLTGMTSNVDYVIGITGYTITLKDGATYTEADFGELPLRVNADNRVWIDFPDSILATLNGQSPVASIDFDTGASQNTSYNGYFTNVFSSAYTPLCFAEGTKIEAACGPVSVEQLKVGDLIRTADSDLQPIRFIICSRYTAQDLKRNERFRPVVISAGSLGPGLPQRDLRVSRQHRVLVSRPNRNRGTRSSQETLVTAIKLTAIPGVYLDRCDRDIAYYHLLFEDHQIVFSEGLATESLLPGPEAINTLARSFSAYPLDSLVDMQMDGFKAKPARHIASQKNQKNIVKTVFLGSNAE